MKSILFKSCALFALLATATSCSDDMKFADTTATPVNQFYEPADGKTMKLVASNSASLLFEWEAAHAGSGAVPQYEVVFTTADGDLDHPIYRVTSDNTGSKTMATISHKTLSKVLAAAGVESGETGTIKWGVVSYAGVNGTKSTQLYTLTLTRFEGFAEVPTSLYMAGEGTESGADLSTPVSFTALDSETYEIFTKLTAGQKIYFSADKEGTELYSLRSNKIVEGEDGGTGVDETGVYRLTLDFATASASVKKIDHLYMRFTDFSAFTAFTNPNIALELNYEANGVYRSAVSTIVTKDTGWSWDPFESRYNFLMEYSDGSQCTWGPQNSGEDSKPGSVDISSSYFKLLEYDGVVSNKWKLADVWYNTPIVLSVYFNSDLGGYTHFAEVQ